MNTVALNMRLKPQNYNCESKYITKNRHLSRNLKKRNPGHPQIFQQIKIGQHWSLAQSHGNENVQVGSILVQAERSCWPFVGHDYWWRYVFAAFFFPIFSSFFHNTLFQILNLLFLLYLPVFVDIENSKTGISERVNKIVADDSNVPIFGEASIISEDVSHRTGKIVLFIDRCVVVWLSLCSVLIVHVHIVIVV